MSYVRSIVENRAFHGVILGVICFNAVLFGLQTSPGIVAVCGSWLNGLDSACLVIFTI